MTSGSASAFCAEVRAPLVGALTLYCGDRWLAEELAQEALASAVAVRDAVRQLPDRQRQAIVCRYYVQLSVRETAVAMRCAEGTVRALTSQGLRNLRGAGLDVDAPTEPSEVTHDA